MLAERIIFEKIKYGLNHNQGIHSLYWVIHETDAKKQKKLV